MMRKYRKRNMLLLAALCMLLGGCGDESPITIDFLKSGSSDAETKAESDGPHMMSLEEYDSKDTAVIVRVSEEEKTITFLNRVVNKNYTLSYDGTTVIMDKYGEALSVAQLMPGDIVDVNFQHIPKKCVSITGSAAAWDADVTDGFEVNPARSQIAFHGEVYTLAERMVLLSQGEEIELADLNERDVLSVRGIENTIYSILVKKGHGYLRLTGAEYFTGGFIEIGQVMAQRITEDMLLTVPEGAYKVVVRNGSHAGSKETEIYRDEETQLDISDLKGEEIRTGKVFFSLTPADADVYIDGEKVDTSGYVTLEYGVHQMIVKAAGYETISQYLKVGQENASLDVEMELSGEGAETGTEASAENGTAAGTGAAADTAGAETGAGAVAGAADAETGAGAAAGAAGAETEAGAAAGAAGTETELPGNSNTVTADGTWHVKINAPAKAEVYVDGNYVGLAPVSFPKKAGSHVISLRRSGYQTRSYTIQVDEEEKDMELSFSELVKKQTTGLNTMGLGEEGQWTNDILSQTLLKS